MTRTVLVPSSLARDAEDQRMATRKLGYVARAAAVFRIDRLCVFPDPDGEETWDGDFVETVLAYAATPPYLRKAVWDRRDELSYAGVLPPLRLTPRTGSGSTSSGSLRQGIVTQVGSDGRVWVNCGLQHPISIGVPDSMSVTEGERVTVRVASREPIRARLESVSAPLSVGRTELRTALENEDAGLRIAASRHGESLTTTRLSDLVDRVTDDGLTVAFGAPERGLPTILGLEASTPPSENGPGFDVWLNTIPTQGSETVRTEEALFATLAPLSLTE